MCVAEDFGCEGFWDADEGSFTGLPFRGGETAVGMRGGSGSSLVWLRERELGWLL